MKHFVNLCLLFFFTTLVASGLMRFLMPFDLITTRVHIVFGAGTLLLVGLHLSSRGKYFSGLFRNQRNKTGLNHPAGLVIAVLFVWLFFISSALWNFWPADLLVSSGYESRHAGEIFRDNSKTAFEPIESGIQIKRVTDDQASIRLEVEWGPAFSAEPSLRMLLGSNSPQMAIWAENENGTVLETLFVSQSCAASNEFNWFGRDQARSDILPVWYSRYKDLLGKGMEESVDAISAATPVQNFSMESYLQMDAQPFSVYVEVNAPNDGNDFFNHHQPSDSLGYTPEGIGQPSVVYEAFVFPEEQRRYFLLELSNYGKIKPGEESELIPDLKQLTTAKQIIEKILLQVTWPAESS